jgi:hypothetical protein
MVLHKTIVSREKVKFQWFQLVNDRQRVLPNNRIAEYSALYRHRIFGVGRIVGLYRIFGVFFTE